MFRFIDNILSNIRLNAVLIDESVDSPAWHEGLALTLPATVPAGLSAQFRQVIDTEWCIPTSGTTGIAKLVKHTVKSLSKTVKNDKNNNGHTWGLVYDPARFAGIQVILQAIIGGTSLVVSDAGDSLVEQSANLLKSSVTALSGTPTMWRRLLMIEDIADLRLRQVTLGGEIADRKILKSLKESFPQARITHIYASTEAGVAFSVHDGKEGFPYSWINKYDDNARLRISDQSTLMVRKFGTSQTYVNRNDVIFDEEGWYDTGDLVEVVNERVLFLGRINGSINVGGNKVMPEEIERHLEELDYVSESIVQAKKSSIVGNLLEASVVLSTNEKNHNEVIRKIKLHCTTHLSPYKVPAFIKVVHELPITTSGKLNRSL